MSDQIELFKNIWVRGKARICSLDVNNMKVRKTIITQDMIVNGDLTVHGDVIQTHTLHVENFIIGDDINDILQINSMFRVNSNAMYMKYAGPDGDQYIYFYQGTSPTGASIKWDDTLAQFVFSHPISGISAYLPIIVDYGTALPAPSATYEGRPGTIRGDATHRSRTYWCERSDAQVFQWVEFVNGGA